MQQLFLNKQTNHFLILLVFALSYFFQQIALASDYQHELGGGLHYYSGLEDQSLAPNTGTFLRFGATTINKDYYRWVANLSIISASNTASFSDNGTSTDIAYRLTGGEFNFGFAVVPLGNFQKNSVQPFFGVTGSLQINSITFTDPGTLSATFPKADAPMFMGYALQVGADILMSKNWGMSFIVEQSKITGQVANATFAMSGNRVILNFFVR